MNKIIFFLVIVASLTSCEDTYFPGYPDTPLDDSILLKQVIVTYIDEDTYTVDYTYDGNRLISMSESDDIDTIFNEYIYENDLLVRVNNFYEGELETYSELEYDSNNKLLAYIVYYEYSGSAQKYVFTYNPDTTVTETIYGGDYESQTILQDVYLYSFEGDNIISEVSIEDSDEYHYTYDTKNSAYKNIFAIDVLNLLGVDFGGLEEHSNNLISITEVYDGMSYTDVYEYSYNQQSYPVTASSFFEGELDSTLEYFYE